MNTKVKILLIDNRVAERQIICDAFKESCLDAVIDLVEGMDSAIANLKRSEYNCILLSDRIAGDGFVTQLQTYGVHAPIVLLTVHSDTFVSEGLQNFGIIDVVAESEINSLSIVRIIRNSIRIYESEHNVDLLRHELRDRQAQIANQAQIIAAQRVQINQKNIELIAASQLKSQFLATISHELRTPMHAIQGFSQLLLRMQRSEGVSSQSGRQQEIVERIHNNSQKLVLLLDEIFDFGKLEAGALDLQPQFFDVSAAIDSILTEVTSLVKAKNLTLRVKNNLKNSIIFNDQMRVRQIVINLLSNAIKFTDSGCVCIDLEELPAEGFAIIVRDTGIGIETSEVENIFDVFRQLDGSLSRKYAGTGMGLAIVNALVYMMQGRIIVNSEPGQGSAFRIELPRQIPSFIPDCNLSAESSTVNAIAPHHSLHNSAQNYNYSRQDVFLFPNQRNC